MNHGMLWTSSLLALLVFGCGSQDNPETENTTGGSSDTSGTTAAGGASSSTTAISGGGTASGTTSTNASNVFINEFVASNKTGATDASGAHPDWVELYTSSATDVSLAGFYISDDPTNPTKAALDAALTITAGGVLVLWADGDTTQGVLHLPFKLSAAAEGVYLYDANQQLLDSVEWTAAAADTAYARFPDGTGAFSWCATPTYNALNGSACGG